MWFFVCIDLLLFFSISSLFVFLYCYKVYINTQIFKAQWISRMLICAWVLFFLINVLLFILVLKFIACAILSALILVELILLLIYYVYIIKTNRTLDINDFAIIDFVALQKENDAKIELLNKNNKKWDALKNSKKYNILFNQYEKLDNEINSVNKKNYFITIEKVIEFNETYVSYFNIKLNYSLKKLSLILLIKLQKSDILSS